MSIYDTIDILAKSNGFSKRHAGYLKIAYDEAMLSSFDGFSLGCIIVAGNKIIGRGHNSEKSSPVQKKYNLAYKPFRKGKYSNRQHSLHAEMAAINSCCNLEDKKNLRAYIVRASVGKDFGIGIASPCPACAHALADVGVKEVIFSTDYGFASSRLSVVDGLVI